MSDTTRYIIRGCEKEIYVYGTKKLAFIPFERIRGKG